MTIRQIKRKVDKVKNAQKDYAGRETQLPTKKETDQINPRTRTQRPRDIDLTRRNIRTARIRNGTFFDEIPSLKLPPPLSNLVVRLSCWLYGIGK